MKTLFIDVRLLKEIQVKQQQPRVLRYMLLLKEDLKVNQIINLIKLYEKSWTNIIQEKNGQQRILFALSQAMVVRQIYILSQVSLQTLRLKMDQKVKTQNVQFLMSMECSCLHMHKAVALINLNVYLFLLTDNRQVQHQDIYGRKSLISNIQKCLTVF